MTPREDIRRSESQVELSGFGERYCRSWTPPSPVRAMVIVHGYAEHTGRYDEMAMYFAERNFVVRAYDQAGHGRTAGPRGHVDRFDRLVDDLDEFLKRLGRDYPGLPVALVGHSMGGLVVAATAAFRKPAVEQVVLSGASLQLGSKDYGWRQRLSLSVARILSLVAPRFPISMGLDSHGLSRDPEVIRRYEEDPLVKDRMSVRFASGLGQMIQTIRDAAGEIDRPIMILHGGEDPICAADGSRRFFAGLSSQIAAQSVLKIYPELRHEIFQETERQLIWQDMLRFIER